jgi:hypothetical protein
MAVVSILLATIGTILFTSYYSYYGITQMNEDKMIGDILYDYVTEQVARASSLEILHTDHIVINDTTTLMISNGVLCNNGQNIYSDAFYNNTTVCMTVEPYNLHAVDIHFYVYRNGEKTYHVGSVIKLLNYQFPA